MTSPVDRTGRFLDADRGGGVYQGYQDALSRDPFNKKFLARNYKQYDVLKKAGLGKVKNLDKLAGLTDTQLEGIAAKAVLKQKGYKPKKLQTSYNRKKYNIRWAKKVMERNQSGATVRKQTLQRTKEARQHIKRINHNRRVMKTRVFANVPKGF